MVAPCIVVLQPDDVKLVRGVGTIHQLEEPDLDLGLRIEKVDVLNVITVCDQNMSLMKSRVTW